MTDIAVQATSDGVFEVEVRRGGRVTRHTVSVPPGLAARLSCDAAEPVELVRASFVFLLEREPPSAILRSFQLDKIADYFPEYRSQIADYVARRT